MLALPVSLSLLVGLLLIAFGVAGYAWIANHRRQELVGRTMTGTDFARARRSSALLTADGQKAESLQARLLRKFPSLKIEDSKYDFSRSRSKSSHQIQSRPGVPHSDACRGARP